jgi:hypothetical protein
LRGDGLLLFKRQNLPALADGGKECMGSKSRFFLLPISRMAAPVRGIAAKLQPYEGMRARNRGRLSLSITGDRKERKGFNRGRFTRVDKNQHWSVSTLWQARHVELFRIRNIVEGQE